MEIKKYFATFEGELALFKGAELAKSKFSDDEFKQTSSTGGFLARVQLMTSNSAKCKAGEFQVNHYALVDGQDLTDLGAEIDVVVVAWRPKALEMGDEIITVYDPKFDAEGNSTGEFARIEAASFVKESGCMFGQEYLVFVPSKKMFATLFFGGITSRRESPKMKAQMLKVATLKVQKIEGKKYTWFAMQVFGCSTPQKDLPTIDVINKEIEKFNNPEVEEVERVEDKAEVRAR